MTNPSPHICRNGHPRTPESTLVRPDGTSHCRICNRARVARNKRKVRAAAGPTLPFGPLAEWIEVRYEREPSIRNVMWLCDVSKHKAHRWQRSGRLPIYDADWAAIKLGYHPVQIWPEWLEVA